MIGEFTLMMMITVKTYSDSRNIQLLNFETSHGSSLSKTWIFWCQPWFNIWVGIVNVLSYYSESLSVILDHSNWSWYSYAQSYDRRKFGSYWNYRMSALSYEIIDALLILIVDNHWISIKTAIIYVVTK